LSNEEEKIVTPEESEVETMGEDFPQDMMGGFPFLDAMQPQTWVIAVRDPEGHEMTFECTDVLFKVDPMAKGISEDVQCAAVMDNERHMVEIRGITY